MIASVRSVAALGMTLLAGIEGCTRQRQAIVGSPSASQSPNATCAASIGTLPSGTSVSSVAGEYRLTLVATGGPRSGRRTSGSLKLDLPPRTTAGVTSLTGTSSIALDSVGAVAPGARGDFAVTALQWARSTNGVMTQEITVRFGTITAPAGTRVIEGAHMALFLTTIAGDGFSGRWDSGAGDMQVQGASGHFCAVHVK